MARRGGRDGGMWRVGRRCLERTQSEALLSQLQPARSREHKRRSHRGKEVIGGRGAMLGPQLAGSEPMTPACCRSAHSEEADSVPHSGLQCLQLETVKEVPTSALEDLGLEVRDLVMSSEEPPLPEKIPISLAYT
ncbi:hypothetical protein NDU88_005418 [Pleurodeles waltl]|uniref:Uncharacterized protein n=1 Tax=Pleurodeles waltl TaxID=8319 RepID=A0AAV7N045_PLEWA|nr:hypothetical protein NDU88_005418 [Pleurodeles waltl]